MVVALELGGVQYRCARSRATLVKERTGILQHAAGVRCQLISVCAHGVEPRSYNQLVPPSPRIS